MQPVRCPIQAWSWLEWDETISPSYSARRVSAGSIRLMRKVGRKQAIAAIEASKTGTATNVTGS